MKPSTQSAQRDALHSLGGEPVDMKASSHDDIEVVERYFSADGRPAKRAKTGAARVAHRYDENGHQLEESYFDAAGQPMNRKDIGAARISWSYDASGKRGEAVLFGADGAQLAGAAKAGGD